MSDILTNKSYKTYNYVSRYASFPTYYHTIDKTYIYGTTGQLSKNVSYVSHIVKKGDTLDSLSLFYYNSPLYYWVIADFNSIQDTIDPLNVGAELRIPTLSSIVYED